MQADLNSQSICFFVMFHLIAIWFGLRIKTLYGVSEWKNTSGTKAIAKTALFYVQTLTHK